MTELDRVVAGISCRDVLADLSNMIEHDLPAERAAAIGRHVAACRVCESFGGRFAEMVRRLREICAPEGSALPADTAARLHDRLAHEYTRPRE